MDAAWQALQARIHARCGPVKRFTRTPEPEGAEAVEEVPCGYSGESFSLGINPDYIGNFLGAVDTERVNFELKDENSQCIGIPVDGDDRRYLCVIMPMRV